MTRALNSDPQQSKFGDVSSKAGSINFTSSGSNISLGGDLVGRDKITATVNANTGMDAGQMVELSKSLAEIKRQVNDASNLDDDDKAELRETVGKIEDEVKKGDQANPIKVERWLKFLAELSPEIFEL